MEFYFSKTLNLDCYNGIHLLQDHIGTKHLGPWNDYDYVTTFNIYVVNDTGKYNAGQLKMLVNGFQNTSKYLVSHAKLIANDIYSINEVLDPTRVVSLATDISVYVKLRKLLDEEDVEIEEYLKIICDAGYYYENYLIYKQWPGFNLSIFRDSSTSQAILNKGYQIAIGKYTPDKIFDIVLKDLPDTFEPVHFHFDNTREISRININLLIGRNGVGKTHVLKHLINIMTGVSGTKTLWPYFHKLIVIAYSPFEDFYTETHLLDILESKFGNKPANRNKPVKSLSRKLKINKYSYIGFKNKNGVFDLQWPKEHSSKSLISVLEYDKENNWWEEKGRLDLLKETLKLSIPFDHICLKTKKNELIKVESSNSLNGLDTENDLDLKSGIIFIKDEVELSLSSGQIIYSYMLPALVAEIEKESLLILDEPELYLHPSIEVGLINMIKHLLAETSSYAIIASHSAVLAREIAQAGINILRYVDGKTQVSLPTFETYGESLDLIIGEAFEDYETPKPYQFDLDRTVSTYTTIDEAITALGPDIGDEALSYIIARYANGETSDIVLEDI